MKLKTKVKKQNIVVIIIIIVILISFVMIRSFNNNISFKTINIIEKRINKISNDIIMDSFNNKLLDNYDINNIIKITRNKNDEIIAVDFDLNRAYLISLDVTKNIKQTLKNLEDKYFEKNDLLKKINDQEYIILVPIGLSSNNVYFSNLGPKVPVKISYIDNIVTGLSTNVKNYGINNALIEVYMNITMYEEVLIPYIDKKINNSCKILISSQIIEGIVPDLYNGLISSDSSLINIPLNK